MDDELLLTVEAAAARIDADPRFIRLMAKIGILECERDGYEIRIHPAALATFDASQKAAKVPVEAVPDETYLRVA